MARFKDNAGRTWPVIINVDAVKRVKETLKFDDRPLNLMTCVEDGEFLARLAADPVLLCDLIFVVCKPDADAQGVTDTDFGRAMAGDAIEHATDAFLEALVEFFPAKKRRLLGKALAKLSEFQDLAIEHAEKELENPALRAAVEKALSTTTDYSLSSAPLPEWSRDRIQSES